MSILPFRRRAVGAAAAAALALALSACASKPPQTFDLTAPAKLTRSSKFAGNLIVAEPVAVATLDGQRVVVKPTAGEVTYLGNAQWSDRLPKLVQAKIIEAYENSSRLTSVGRPGDRLTVDYQLISELRAFEIDAASGQAVVELTAKVIDDKSGKIVAGGVFSARRPVPQPIEGLGATRALDEALGEVLRELVSWSGATRGGV
ncbi:membrane integrity-associated transporter subunit PqiC [Chelatococcus sambhunathii]|uniref:Membrane integrity-associated transporter subunit PqiC n=1 Tax=Chelatococcus sambhunathii TaxID=363953 RepID=A0ABU1DBL7_9HYPH|nr:ABC-type transport auxiliary lipoprotein family protein [Chelatococcus sambhunathii]MDR4305497.1 membrane integrity-associated transporter subunit PqiC [Chelatococcus sambhunathii]